MNITQNGTLMMTDIEALELAQKLIAQVTSLQKNEGSYRHITEDIMQDADNGRKRPSKMSFLIFPAKSVT